MRERETPEIITASLTYAVFYIGFLELLRFTRWTPGSRLSTSVGGYIYLALGYRPARSRSASRTPVSTASLANR